MRIFSLISTVFEMSPDLTRLVLIGIPPMPTLDERGWSLRLAYNQELQQYASNPEKLYEALTYIDNHNLTVAFVESPWPVHRRFYRGCHARRNVFALELVDKLQEFH